MISFVLGSPVTRSKWWLGLETPRNLPKNESAANAYRDGRGNASKERLIIMIAVPKSSGECKNQGTPLA